MLVAQSGDSGEHAYRTGNRSEWIANLVCDRSRQASHGCQAVLHTHFAFQAPDLSKVVEGIDEAQSAALGHRQRGNHDPEGFAKTIGRTEANFRVGRFSADMWERIEEQCFHRLAPQVVFGPLQQLLGCGIDDSYLAIATSRTQTAATLLNEPLS